jgi:hypothetical protein
MASPFLAPRIISALSALPGIFRQVQEALDKISRSGFVLGLKTHDLTPICPSFQRVSPPAAGVRCVLPRADETNAGQAILLNLENAAGSLTVFPAPGQTVNGATTAVFTEDGVVELWSNGSSGWFGFAQLPVGGAGTPTWAQVLLAGATSGLSNPIVDAGQFIQFGAVGPTTGQLRSGDNPFRMHGSSALQLIGDTSALLSGGSGATVVSVGTTFGVTTSSTTRLSIATTGQWTLGAVAGSSGQFMKHQGAANPTWATFALADLPSQAADTFLGRLAGSGTPTAQTLASLASTSLVYDATSHTFQLAALTGGDIARSQNSVSETINNDAVTNAKLANMASPRLKGRTTAATGDPEDLTLTNSTSATWNTGTGGAIAIERAALTGEVTAGANANATTIVRSTDFNTSPNNQWTGTHRFDAGIGVTGEIAPAQFVAQQNNFALGPVSILRFTLGGNQSLTGMVPAFDGQLVILKSADSGDVLSLPHASGSSTVTNTFDNANDATIGIAPGGAVLCYYDATLDRFCPVVPGDLPVSALSVLCNASNASALPSYFGGGSALGCLRYNSAGTALEWADPIDHQYLILNETPLSPPTTAAGTGRWWVRDTTPNRPMFSDDSGLAHWELVANRVNSLTTTQTVSAGTGTIVATSASPGASSWAAGTMYRVEGYLTVNRGATATACNVTVNLTLNGTVYATFTAALPTATGNYGVHVQGYLRCASIGAAGAFIANVMGAGSGLTASAGSGNTANSATTQNTATSLAISLNAAMSASVAGLSMSWTHAAIYRWAQS